MQTSAKTDVRIVGRYALYGVIAAGGMATVHFGRLLGPVGFSRTVAIKRLHPHFASDPEFVSMFLDEARLAARVRHPNVIPTLDVVATEGELFLVMEYVPGETLAKLVKNAREQGRQIPHRMISAMIVGMLHGLHAAHEANDERGMPLGIVHRDVSPQNLHIGTDGVPRVLDFGVAKAAGRIQTTREGQIKGKLAYMPPEQLRGASVTRQCDIYSTGVMLWELVTGTRLFVGDNEGVVVTKVLEGNIEAPSSVVLRAQNATLSPKSMDQMRQLDACVMRALHRDPAQRFATAKEMARALEDCIGPATTSQIAEWVERTAPDILQSRADRVAEIESADATPAHMLKQSAEGMAEANARGSTHDLATLETAGRPAFGADGRPRPPAHDPNNTLSQPSTISVGSFANAAPAAARGPSKSLLVIAVAALFALLSLVVLLMVIRTTSNKPMGDTPNIGGVNGGSQPSGALLTAAPAKADQSAEPSASAPATATNAVGEGSTNSAAPASASATTTAAPTATAAAIATGARLGTNAGGKLPHPAATIRPPTTVIVTPVVAAKPVCQDESYMDGPIKKYRQICR